MATLRPSDRDFGVLAIQPIKAVMWAVGQEKYAPTWLWTGDSRPKKSYLSPFLNNHSC